MTEAGEPHKTAIYRHKALRTNNDGHCRPMHLEKAELIGSQPHINGGTSAPSVHGLKPSSMSYPLACHTDALQVGAANRMISRSSGGRSPAPVS